MASTDREYEIRALRRQIKHDRVDGLRSIWTRGRSIEANIHVKQLKTFSYAPMRNAAGAFYFVVGYSRVGGSDVVRP